jgi:rod shape-determining protein MreC
LFLRESGAGYLLLALAIVSSLLTVVDVNSGLLQPVRGAIGTVIGPIYAISEAPYWVAHTGSELIESHDSISQRNADLERRVLELSEVAQRFTALEEENARLRELLGSRQTLRVDVRVAELVGIVPAANTFQVIIDKGATSDVKIGQAVIDAEGLFGQVVEVSPLTSRVMLVTDAAFAVPVQVMRNDFRSIAAGTGELGTLELEYVPVTADIKEGDELVTSGLGGTFPRGYPVAEVISVDVDPTLTYAKVRARPLAALDRSRHVLLVFGVNPVSDDAVPDAKSEESTETGATS